MSIELELSTSPAQRRPPNIRIEAWRPFDPYALGVTQPRLDPPPASFLAPPTRQVEEHLSLLGGRREKRGWAGRERGGGDLASALTLLSGVALWMSILAVLAVMYWKFSEGMTALQTAAQPYFGDAVNHTMSILHNVDQSTIGANEMVTSAQTITDRAVPAMQTMMNQTEKMLSRLEKLAANPVMQISLGHTAPG